MAYYDVQELHESDEALSCLSDTRIISHPQPQAQHLSLGHSETQWVLQDTIGSSFSLHAESCAHTRGASTHQPKTLPHAPIYTPDAIFDPVPYLQREQQSYHDRSFDGSHTLPDVSSTGYHPSVSEHQPHTFIPPLRNPYLAETYGNPYAPSASSPFSAADGGHVSLGHNYGFPSFQFQHSRDRRLFQNPLAPPQDTFTTPVHYMSNISSSFPVVDGRHVSLAHNYSPLSFQSPILDTANWGQRNLTRDRQLFQHPLPLPQNTFATGTERKCWWRGCGERFILREENKEDFTAVEKHIDSHLDIEGYPVYSALLDEIKCLWNGCTKGTYDGEGPQTYTWRKDLKRHIFESHRMQGKRILCPYDGCTSSFTRKGSLNRHVEKKHMWTTMRLT